MKMGNRQRDEKKNTNEKKGTVKIIVFFSVSIVLVILEEFVFKKQLADIENRVWLGLQDTALGPWIFSIILWVFGGAAWVATYVGPLIAARKNEYVSGIPGVAFILFLLAGLLSPYKWLAVIAAADFGILVILIRSIFGSRSQKKERDE